MSDYRPNDRRYTERESDQTIKRTVPEGRYEGATPVESNVYGASRHRRSDRHKEETRQDPSVSGDTGVYPRKTGQDRSDRSADHGSGSGRGPVKPLLPILLFIAALILLAAALYLMKVDPLYSGLNRILGRNTEPRVEETAPVSILSFTSDSSAYTTGTRFVLHMTTDSSAASVRILDPEKNILDAVSTRTGTADPTIAVWDVGVLFNSPYTGNVYASAMDGNGKWTDSDMSVFVAVSAPTATAVPTYTPLPTQAPTVTETPYTASRAVVSSPEPSVTETPTVPPTDAPTAIPEATVFAVLTDEPVPEATPAPTETPAPTPTPSPTPEPTPTPSPTPMTASAAEGRNASDLGLTEKVYSGAKVQSNYNRSESIIVQDADRYSYFEEGTGIYTFRGDNFRRNGAYGVAGVSDARLELKWEYPLSSLRTEDSGTLYGVGWNNQPAIIKWTKEVRNMMNLYTASKDEAAMREVIFSGQDGYVYFINLKTGEASRDAINIGYPLRGSVSVDTEGRPMMSFGQAISRLPSKTGPIGYYVYNLLDCTQMLFINGRSSDNQKQYSSNGAFDSCSLFVYNQGRDAMVVAGENGLLYTVELNTDFDYPKTGDTDPVTPAISISPSIIYQSSLAKGEKEGRTTVESAPAMYGTYVYLADGYGIIRCVDTDSMRTVWALDAGDNTDAAMALDLIGDELSLYTGTTAYQRTAKADPVVIRRINALTGEEIWKYDISCVKDNTSETSGCKASPVIGQHDLSGLVFFTVNRVSEGGAKLIALDKASGKAVWEFAMGESVSSPVAVYNSAGNGWIIACDGDGRIYILDGLSGYLNSTTEVDGKIEASPAVYNDLLVIGTCSKNPKMYCFTIR